MSLSSDTALTIAITIISLIAGMYSVLTGILALAKRDIKIPGFYQLGIFIFNLLYGKASLTNFEKEMMNPKKSVRYGIFWILTGLVALVIGVFFLFVR